MTLSGTFLKGAAGALGLAVALAVASPAHAQATSSAKPSLFQRLDANHDGKVTQDEYMAYRDATVWKKYDSRNTGSVSKKTYVQGSRERSTAFARLDANGDGVLQKSEFDEETRRLFEKRDRNHDGVLTADEFRAPRAARAPKTQGTRG
jgi:Ca2+-binding EF-hand superfamily protein